MGYELVKLDDDGEPFDVIDWDDTNYFRLNTEVIGIARTLSLWGAGIILNTDMIDYEATRAVLYDNQPTIEQVAKFNRISKELKVEWIKPFTTNNEKTVASPLCIEFANNLRRGLESIQESPVRPDIDLDLLWGFVEFLQNSPNGVWLE